MTEPASRTSPRPAKLGFVGVTTGGSSIMSLFEVWAELLDIDAEIVGYDLPLGASPADYRACIAQLAADPQLAGALITTHKAAVFDHAADMFATLDEHAVLCREISCVARRPAGLAGCAKDPITAGLALDHLLGEDYFARREADAVCLGGGGTGLAIAVRLLTQAAPPRRVVLVDRDPRRLALAHKVGALLGDVGPQLVCLVHDDVSANDGLVSASPEGTLIINATGMGKDLPGSPVSSAARFPRGAVAWDLNYRGDLEFLDVARAQAEERDLLVSDGWRYFLHGWTEVMAEVFELEMTAERFDRLAAAAARASGRADDTRNLSGRPG